MEKRNCICYEEWNPRHSCMLCRLHCLGNQKKRLRTHQTEAREGPRSYIEGYIQKRVATNIHHPPVDGFMHVWLSFVINTLFNKLNSSHLILSRLVSSLI